MGGASDEDSDRENTGKPPRRRTSKNANASASAASRATEEPDLAAGGDYGNVALLLLLYFLQGVPMGLSQTLDLTMQEKRLPMQLQAIYALVSWPYSLKMLWAPLVDSVYSPRIGRRKSWLLPVQTLMGLVLLATCTMVPQLLEDIKPPPVDPAAHHAPPGGHSVAPQTHTHVPLNASEAAAQALDDATRVARVHTLAALFFGFYFLSATQDVAVDGWALELLAKRNLGWASTCNAIGLNLGYYTSFTGFMVLKQYGWCTLESFMWWSGALLIATTAALAAFKTEKPQPQAVDDMSVRESYVSMGRVLRLSSVKLLVCVLLTRSLAFAATDALSTRMLLGKGMKKESLSSLMALLTPISMALPGLIARYTATAPLALFARAFVPRFGLAVASVAMVYLAPDFDATGGEIPAQYWYALAGLSLVGAVVGTAQFVSLMAFFAKVSDPAVGGSFMTALNTATNLGNKWPTTLVMFVVPYLTIPDVVDGYYVASGACLAMGVVWFAWCSPILVELEALPEKEWRVR